MKNDLMMMNTNPYTMGMLSPTMFGTVPYGGYTMTGSIHGPAGTPEDIAEKKFLETPDDAVTNVDLKKAEASLPQKSAQEETKGHERHLKDQNNKPILFVDPKNELKNPNKPKNLIVKNIEVPKQVAQRLLKSNVQSAKRSKNQIVQQRNLKTKKPVLKAKSTKKVAVNGAHKNPVRAAPCDRRYACRWPVVVSTSKRSNGALTAKAKARCFHEGCHRNRRDCSPCCWPAAGAGKLTHAPGGTDSTPTSRSCSDSGVPVRRCSNSSPASSCTHSYRRNNSTSASGSSDEGSLPSIGIIWNST